MEINEIANLFLTGTRDRVQSAHGDRPRPVRIPPGGAQPRPTVHVELKPPPEPELEPEAKPETPEEIRLEAALNDVLEEEPAPTHRPAHLIIAPHLGEDLVRTCGQIANALTPPGSRLGVLIEGHGLYLLEPGLPADGAGHTECGSVRELSEHVTELTLEVDAWVLAIQDIDAGWELLARTGQWIVPAQDTEDGTVAAYRTIKTLAALGPTPITLASETEPHRLRAVMQRFLACTPERTLPLASGDAPLHPLLHFTGDPREVMADLLLLAPPVTPSVAPPVQPTAEPPVEPASKVAPELPPEPALKPAAPVAQALSQSSHTEPARTLRLPEPSLPEVIDLGDDTTVQRVVEAARRADSALRPLDLPWDESLTLALDPDGRVVLLAEIGSVHDLAHVGKQLNWLADHLPLLAHAARPELVNTALPPLLRLYVDAALEPMSALLPQDATVIPYRRLRWGTRIGLLLAA